MKAIKGLFDGKTVKLLEKVDIKELQEVIITFLGSSMLLAILQKKQESFHSQSMSNAKKVLILIG